MLEKLFLRNSSISNGLTLSFLISFLSNTKTFDSSIVLFSLMFEITSDSNGWKYNFLKNFVYFKSEIENRLRIST